MLATPGIAANPAAAARELERIGAGTERVSAEVAPKVVQILTQSVKVAGAGDEQPNGVLISERGRGSGLFVSANGYALTNAHVVANATRIRIVAQGGAEYAATIAGIDADNDLALLQTDARNVAYFDVALDAAPRQGQLVLAFGSPMGLTQSASLGLVSALDRQLSPDDPRAYLQTDASMNPGNSGGPLVDLDGRLLGVNTMILSQSGGSEGLGFAIPLEVVRRAYAALRAHGSVPRAQLGLQPRSLTPELIAGLELRVRKGVLVEDVDPNGPASAAGVRPGDVIVGIGEAAIRTLRDLYTAEYDMPAGQSDLAVMRGADLRFLRITPVFTGKPQSALSAGITEKENLVFGLGIYATTLTPKLAATLGGSRAGPGALVLALTGMSTSGHGAEPGDIIHAVNHNAVDSVESLRAALEPIAAGAPLVLQMERAGVLSYLTAGVMPAAAQLKRTDSGAHTSHAALRF
jgi:serine protease Do